MVAPRCNAATAQLIPLSPLHDDRFHDAMLDVQLTVPGDWPITTPRE